MSIREALEAARDALHRMDIEGGHGLDNHKRMGDALAKINAALREMDEAKPPPDVRELCDAVTAALQEYGEDYEYAEGCGYVPNDAERVLILDALHGLTSDEGLLDCIAAWRNAVHPPVTPLLDADQAEPVALPFSVRDVDGTLVMDWHTGGTTPMGYAEKVMWRHIDALQARIRALESYIAGRGRD